MLYLGAPTIVSTGEFLIGGSFPKVCHAWVEKIHL
jgi:hypothetical protein